MRFIRGLTLQEMCLRVIVKDLDNYIYSYNGNRSIPQRHIDFLHRVYSNECFLKYTKKRSKSEECLLWFLSSYNKTVYLSRITENIMRKLQIVGPVITSLTLAESLITENMLNAVISVVPHVSHLNLRQTECSDQTLLCIGRMCPLLVTLDLEDCPHVSDYGIANLCDNTLPLKDVNILHTDVYYVGVLDLLTQMPYLESINCENLADIIFGLYEAGLKDFDKDSKFNLTQLTYSKIESNRNPLDVIMTCALLCPKIEEFQLLFPASENVLELCSRFPHLKRLKFYVTYSNALAPVLPLANNLTALILCCGEIPGTPFLENFKNLKSLSLIYVSFTHFKEEEIKLKCTNLDTLKIKSLDLSNETNYKVIALLISLSKNVTRLSFDHIQTFPAELINIILNSMTKLSCVRFCDIFSNLPSSVLKFFEIPSMKKVAINAWVESFVNFYHTDDRKNSLSWRLMYNDIDDFDDEFEQHFKYQHVGSYSKRRLL